MALICKMIAWILLLIHFRKELNKTQNKCYLFNSKGAKAGLLHLSGVIQNPKEQEHLG
jgi:hypothetical protein